MQLEVDVVVGDDADLNLESIDLRRDFTNSLVVAAVEPDGDAEDAGEHAHRSLLTLGQVGVALV